VFNDEKAKFKKQLNKIEEQTIAHIEESFPALESKFLENFDKHLG
jgi:hypothetical protein